MSDVVIALDVGDARIGVARGELGSRFAFGRGHLARSDTAHDVAAVKRIVEREGAVRVVVGLPQRTDGSDSPQTKRVRKFARALERQGLEVCFEDERFTTQLAGRHLLASEVPKRKRREKGRLDEAAAVLILESYLQRSKE
ncbi:MAG: Holliday junction resolvase RuvX [Trueperaceae bacterium]|nr:MAG: Holliday junction resolvase RuvX [Trueperaceae bacterium]